MTRRDYELVARTIAAMGFPINRAIVAMTFAIMFKQDNPKFKPHLFYRACGLHDDGSLKE